MKIQCEASGWKEIYCISTTQLLFRNCNICSKCCCWCCFFLYFSGNLIVKQTAEKEEEKKIIKRIIVKNDDWNRKSTLDATKINEIQNISSCIILGITNAKHLELHIFVENLRWHPSGRLNIVLFFYRVCNEFSVHWNNFWCSVQYAVTLALCFNFSVCSCIFRIGKSRWRFFWCDSFRSIWPKPLLFLFYLESNYSCHLSELCVYRQDHF